MKGAAFGRFRNDQEWVAQDGGEENIAEEKKRMGADGDEGKVG